MNIFNLNHYVFSLIIDLSVILLTNFENKYFGND